MRHNLWPFQNGMFSIGWIQTLFLRILKSLNIEISTRPSDSASKMSQKFEKLRFRDFRDVWNFSIQSFLTLTRFCGNTVFQIWNLTGPSERGPRDLWGSVLWRYTDMAIMLIFMILINWSNRRLSEIRNHKLTLKKFYIMSQFWTTNFLKKSVGNILII